MTTEDRPWMVRAACGVHPPEWWDPPDPACLTIGNNEAIRICLSCPVKPQCKEASAGEPWGIWAGEIHTPDGRTSKRRRNRIPADSARQALIAAVWVGWPVAHVARITGIEQRTLHRIHRGQSKQVRPDQADLIHSVCRRLVRKAPPIGVMGGGVDDKNTLTRKRNRGSR